MTAPISANDSVSDSRSNFIAMSNSSPDTTRTLNQLAREVDQKPEQEFDIMNETITPDDVENVSGSDFSSSTIRPVDTQQCGRRSNSKVVKNSKEVQDMTDSISPSDRPNVTWTLESLENYAQDRAAEINNFGRKTIVETWLFGESLSLIRNIQKGNGGWMKWVHTQPYSLSTATNAIKVYERVNFDDLALFKDMTVSDMKSALEIIKSPPPQRRRSEKAVPVTQEVVKDQTPKVGSPEADDQSADGGLQQSTKETADDAPESAAVRKMTTTDYTQPRQKNPVPQVGPSLTVSEVLGTAFTLLVEAEKIGITPDSNDILTQISDKVAVLIQALNVEAVS